MFWVRILIVVFWLPSSFANSSLPQHSHDCPDWLREISITQIQPTQIGLRHPQDRIDKIDAYQQTHGRLPKPAILVITEDGEIYSRDGHHDISRAAHNGIQSLQFSRGDFIFDPKSRESFDEVNLASGWVTPMKLGQDFRRAELAGWKKLIHLLKPHLSEEQLIQFIRSHPEAYLTPKGQSQDEVGGAPNLSHRDPAEYQNYLLKMDQTMPMKIGQLIPALPSRGILVELGFGTGQQSYAIAANNPNLLVVGIDLEMSAVHQAASRFQLPNLVFLQGNALESYWPSNFVDAFIESSFTHEIFSYGNPKFQIERVEKLRAELARALKPGGTYGFRDFVKPNWPEKILLKLSRLKRDGPPPFGNLSAAELFEDFSKTEFPTKIEYTEKESDDPLFKVFEVSGDHAANFLLRSRYTNETSWTSERAEKYTYYSQPENIRSLERLGLRVNFAGPVYNQWMIRNWWQSEDAQVMSLDGTIISWPPSNFLSFAVKPLQAEPKKLELISEHPNTSTPWMKQQNFRSMDGAEFDLIHVPGETQIFIPYERTADGFFIYVRRSSERPGLVYYQNQSPLAEANYGGYTPEALSKVFPTPITRTPAELFEYTLREKAGGHLSDSTKTSLTPKASSPYLSSPGGSDEIVYTHFIDMTHEAASVFDILHREIRRVKIDQLLAAAHLGVIPDPRLELAAYELAKREGVFFFKWIGPELNRNVQKKASLKIATSYRELFESQQKVFFETDTKTNFTQTQLVEFDQPL